MSCRSCIYSTQTLLIRFHFNFFCDFFLKMREIDCMSMALVSHPHMVLIYSIRRINTSLLPLLLPCWLWVHAASYPFNLYCVIIPADTNCKVVKIGHYLGWLVGFDSSTRRPFFHFLLIIICIYIFTTISLESCNLAWSWDLLEPSIPLYWGCDGLWEGYPKNVFFWKNFLRQPPEIYHLPRVQSLRYVALVFVCCVCMSLVLSRAAVSRL